MLVKNNFFLNYKKYYQNLKKTKKLFNSFKLELNNFEILSIPLCNIGHS